MKVWLQHVGMTAPPTLLCLDKFPFIIGRRRDCEGCLPYAFISRHHCEFTEAEGRVLVKDLESYNGTFVNGRPATSPIAIDDGDEVTVGPMSFRVFVPRADAETDKAIQTRPDFSHSDAPQPSWQQDQ